MYSFQKHVLAELELNQTKPQLRFSETQEDPKTWSQKGNCHALQSLLVLSETGLRYRNLVVICSFVRFSENKFLLSGDLRIKAIIFYIVVKINNK